MFCFHWERVLYYSGPAVTHVFPPECGLAVLTVDVRHGMQAGEKDPLLRRAAAHIHPVGRRRWDPHGAPGPQFRPHQLFPGHRVSFLTPPTFEQLLASPENSGWDRLWGGVRSPAVSVEIKVYPSGKQTTPSLGKKHLLFRALDGSEHGQALRSSTRGLVADTALARPRQ